MQISVIDSMTIHGGAQRLNSISHKYPPIQSLSIGCSISNMLPDNPFHQSLYNSLWSRLTSLCLAAVRKPGLDLRSHEVSHLK